MLCALLALAGCNKGDGSMTEEQFCQQYASIECSKVSAFCSFNPMSCEPVRVNACREFASRVKGVGHQFNPGNTDRCLKKLEEAYRSLPIGAVMLKAVDETCARVFEGTAKVTEACAADYDCAGGLICDKNHCGVEKVVASRSGCANIGERCPAGEFCTNDSGLFLCVKRLDLGATCSLSRPCAESLRCRTSCVPRLDTQGACSEDDDCLSGYCNRYVTNRTCGLGLTFSPESPSCIAYMGAPDGGTPMRGNNEVGDGGAEAAASTDSAPAAADAGLATD
jgi:hypothetical protein